jgi:Protein of unknown function (DUF4087)
MISKRTRLMLFFCGLLAVAYVLLDAGTQPAITLAAGSLETRCGWFSNPTPANIWLYDRDGEWTIGAQGGYQVPNDWDWPAFKPGQWVVTNAGDHGYGCACFKLRVDRDTRHVLEIRSARARPLATCRQDAALKKWKRAL